MKVKSALLILFLVQGVISAQIQLGNTIYSDQPGDYFGIKVAISATGNTIAAGAIAHGNHLIHSGQVQVFRWDGTEWQRLGEAIYGEKQQETLGTGIALSADGNIVAVGAPLHSDSSYFEMSGQVRVFQWNGKEWAQMGNGITGDIEGSWSGFNLDMSLDGTIVAIGAHLVTGQVRVFKWDGNDWKQRGEPLLSRDSITDYFGFPVALSSDGDIVAVGAYVNSDFGIYTGLTRVFQWDGNNWNQLGKDIPGKIPGEKSGFAVDISSDGKTVIIGARHDINYQHIKSARVYRWDGTKWSQLGNDITGENEFGSAVSISSTGNIVAIGDRGNNVNGKYTGMVQLYQWDGTNWSQLGDDIYGDKDDDGLGVSVALSSLGDTIVIGSIRGEWSTGEVKVYTFENPTNNKAYSKENILEISPNPASDFITIKLLNNREKIGALRVTNALGKTIATRTNNEIQYRLDVESLGPKGVYFIQAFDSKGKFLAVRKVIIQ